MTKLRLLACYALALLMELCGLLALPVIAVRSGLHLAEPLVFYAVNAVQQVMIFAAPALLVLMARQARKERFLSQCRRLRVNTVGYIALLAVSGAVTVALVATLWSNLLRALTGYAAASDALPAARSGMQWLVAILSVGVAPAVSEELFFRALLQETVLRRWPKAGLWITAVVFAAMHLQPEAFPALLLAGLTMGWIYRRYGFWSSVLLHGAYNSVVLALSSRQVGIGGEMVLICGLACWFSIRMLRKEAQA